LVKKIEDEDEKEDEKEDEEEWRLWRASKI
jgi:hypothetical protein